MPSVARWTLPPLNYKRGMRRLYLVLSALWIAVVVAVSINERPRSSSPVVYLDDNGNSITSVVLEPIRSWDENGRPITPSRPDLSKLSEEQLQGYRQTGIRLLVRYWETQSALALAPPAIGYLILFGVLPWIGRGFRSTHF
jgi:hypothetical protein